MGRPVEDLKALVEPHGGVVVDLGSVREKLADKVHRAMVAEARCVC
jgi:hypothetical protein